MQCGPLIRASGEAFYTVYGPGPPRESGSQGGAQRGNFLLVDALDHFGQHLRQVAVEFLGDAENGDIA